MKNKAEIVLFVLIFFLAFIVRFVSLDSVPNGLQQDETSIGYNAYSILKTGKDEHGQYLPLFFKAFGEYKLPLSIYLTSASFSLLGVNEFSLRFPSAFFGVLTVGAIFFLSRKLFLRWEIAIIAMAILALNPWHIHFSRGAYEVTPALFFIVLGFYLYLVFTKTRSAAAITLAVLSFGVSMLGYNIARLFVPVFLAILLFLEIKKIKNLKNKLVLPSLSLFIVVIIFCLPFFIHGGYESTRGTLVPTSAVVQAQNLELRSYIFEANPTVAKLLFNSLAMNILFFLKNVISYLDVQFLFVSGSMHGNHGIGNVGQFYIFEIVTILLGMIALVKSRSKHIFLIISWMAVVIIAASITRESPHATRSFFLIPPLILLSANGFFEVIKVVRLLGRRISIPTFMMLVFVCLYFVGNYIASYHYRFPIQYAKNYRSEDSKIVDFINKNYPKYRTIYIDNKADFIYTSVVFYSKFDPSEFQTTSIRAKDDTEGFSRVLSFGKYEYVDVDSIPDTDQSIIVSTHPIEGYKIVGTFNYPTRPVVIARGQEIVSFPVTDTAYVLLEKN